MHGAVYVMAVFSASMSVALEHCVEKLRLTANHLRKLLYADFYFIVRQMQDVGRIIKSFSPNLLWNFSGLHSMIRLKTGGPQSVYRIRTAHLFVFVICDVFCLFCFAMSSTVLW